MSREKILHLINRGGSYFPAIYLIWAMLSSVGYLANLSVLKVLAAVVALFGAMCMLSCIRSAAKHSKLVIILFAAFFLSYAISAFANRAYGIFGNLKTMVWMGLCLFALYPSAFGQNNAGGKADGRPVFERIIIITMIYTSIMALVGLVMWFANYGVIDSKDTIYGFVWGRLWGAYHDPNYGALISAISISFALLFLMQGKEKHPHRVLLVLHIILLEGYIGGAFSRGTQLVMIATTVVFYVYYIVCRKESLKKKAITGILLVLMLLLPFGIRAVYSAYVEYHNKAIEEQIEEAIEAGLNPEDLDIGTVMKEMEDRGSAFAEGSLSIRMGIWKDGLELIKSSPLFGTSYRNIKAYARANKLGSYVKRRINTMHNMIMDVAVSQGLLGLSILAAAMLVIAVKMIKGWAGFDSDKREKAMFFVLPILTAMGGSLTLSDIFYLNTPTAVMFWISLGQYISLCPSKSGRKLLKKA